MFIISLGSLLIIIEDLLLDSSSNAYYFILSFGVLNLLVLFAFKYLFIGFMQFVRRKGRNTRELLIIANKDSNDFLNRLIEKQDWGYKVFGIIDYDDMLKSEFSEFRYFKKDIDLRKLIDENAIDDIIYAKSIINQSEITELRKLCNEVGVICHVNTTPYSNFDSDTVITFQNTPKKYLQLKVKSAFDFYFSFMILSLLSPILLIISLIIKLQDGGPVFFKQERVGLNGRRFYCYKFRTMVVNAEALKASLTGMNEQDGPVFKIKSDPRITPFGKFLRETSLDELPQFINVLKGEMSVVGPRPPIPSEVEQYQRWQLRRLSIKPGITCTWQVSGRNNIKFDEWMKMDINYIDTWSISEDVKIIFKTVKTMLTKTGY